MEIHIPVIISNKRVKISSRCMLMVFLLGFLTGHDVRGYLQMGILRMSGDRLATPQFFLYLDPYLTGRGLGFTDEDSNTFI